MHTIQSNKLTVACVVAITRIPVFAGTFGCIWVYMGVYYMSVLFLSIGKFLDWCYIFKSWPTLYFLEDREWFMLLCYCFTGKCVRRSCQQYLGSILLRHSQSTFSRGISAHSLLQTKDMNWTAHVNKKKRLLFQKRNVLNCKTSTIGVFNVSYHISFIRKWTKRCET